MCSQPPPARPARHTHRTSPVPVSTGRPMTPLGIPIGRCGGGRFPLWAPRGAIATVLFLPGRPWRGGSIWATKDMKFSIYFNSDMALEPLGENQFAKFLSSTTYKLCTYLQWIWWVWQLLKISEFEEFHFSSVYKNIWRNIQFVSANISLLNIRISL